MVIQYVYALITASDERDDLKASEALSHDNVITLTGGKESSVK